jgi:hypothetical protein
VISYGRKVGFELYFATPEAWRRRQSYHHENRRQHRMTARSCAIKMQGDGSLQLANALGTTRFTFVFRLMRSEVKSFWGTRELLREFPKKAAFQLQPYGRGAGVGRGRGVGVHLSPHGVGDGVMVAVAVGLAVGEPDTVAVAVAVAVGVGDAGLGVGEADPHGLTGQLKISIEAMMASPAS